MMHKIPMSDTVSGAYNFAFKNILSVLGIAWFPYAVAFALIAAGIVALIPSFELLRTGADPSAIGGIIAFCVVAVFVFIVAASMVNVGVLRQALGLHQGQVFIYFNLGAPVWRLIGAMLLMTAIVYGVAAVLIGVLVFIFTAGANVMGQGLATTLGVIGSIAASCFFIYMFVRLFFFLAPVVVAEERIGLGRAWELGGGNFWRILGVYIAVTLPVGIAVNMIATAFIGQPPMVDIQQPMTPGEVFAFYGNVFGHIWPALVVLELLHIIVLTGLLNGAQAVAYKLVTSPAAEQKAQ